MHVASPPLLPHLFLEAPWPVLIVLVGLAAIMRVVGRRNGKAWMSWMALGALVLAVGVWLLAWAVTTDRETLLADTHKLVDATVRPVHMSTLESMIPPDTPIVTAHGVMISRFSQVKQTLKAYPIDTQNITSINAQTSGTKGLSVFSVTTHFRVMNVPIPSTWAFRWKRGASGRWQVSRIVWLTLRHQNPPHRIPNATSSGLFH